MTVIENKLINLKNKITAINGVKRDDIVDLENITNSNIITNTISLEKFTIEESKQYYEVVLSAIDNELNKTVKTEVLTMKDLQKICTKLEYEIHTIIDPLYDLSKSGYKLRDDILENTIFLNNENDELVKIKDLELVDLLTNRLDVSIDLLGDSIYNNIRSYLVDDFDSEDDRILKVLPWLVYLFNNKDTFIYQVNKTNLVFDISNKIFTHNLGFKVKDFNTLIVNVDEIINILTLLINKVKYYSKYENISVLMDNDNILYNIFKTLENMIDNDELSKIIIKKLI